MQGQGNPWKFVKEIFSRRSVRWFTAPRRSSRPLLPAARPAVDQQLIQNMGSRLRAFLQPESQGGPSILAEQGRDVPPVRRFGGKGRQRSVAQKILQTIEARQIRTNSSRSLSGRWSRKNSMACRQGGSCASSPHYRGFSRPSLLSSIPEGLPASAGSPAPCPPGRVPDPRR